MIDVEVALLSTAQPHADWMSCYQHVSLNIWGVSGNGYMRIVVVYWIQCPDPAIGHLVPLSVFFDKLFKIMDNHFTASGKLLVTGDFNFHVDIFNDPEAKCMLWIWWTYINRLTMGQFSNIILAIDKTHSTTEDPGLPTRNI